MPGYDDYDLGTAIDGTKALANVPQLLVYARTGAQMIERRSASNSSCESGLPKNPYIVSGSFCKLVRLSFILRGPVRLIPPRLLSLILNYANNFWNS